MPIGSLYEVDFQYAIASREFISSFGYRMSAGADVPEVCQHLSDTWLGVHQFQLKACLATDVTLECVIARAITKDEAIPGVNNFAAGSIGTGSGFALPAPSALVLKFLTDNLNPKHNGRKFLSGCPEGQLLAGGFSAAFLAGAVKALTDLLEAPFTVVVDGDETFDPVVINRVNAGLPIIPPTASNVTASVGLPTVYQQLGRKTKRTQNAS